MKPRLYIELEGPILVPGPHPDAFLNYEIAKYAKPFLHWAIGVFNVAWLTERGAREAFYVSERLGLPADAIKFRGFELSKAEILDSKETFFWIDAALIPSEVAWLTEHGAVGRLIQVDPLVGVTSQHKQLLETKLRNLGKV